MAITLEEVEKLRAKANVSYEEAKQALEESRGDLLEALIALERRGKTNDGVRGGFFTTQPGAGSRNQSHAGVQHHTPPPTTRPDGGRRGHANGSFWNQLRDLLSNALRALRPGNVFEIWRGEEMMTSMPVVILVVLAIVPFWITWPLLVVGLFFGCRYRFSGPDLPEEAMNNAMGAVSDTVDGMVDEVKREFDKNKKR